MSSLRAVEARLPPGFRFHPTDDELLCDYLMKKKLAASSNQNLLLIEVDLNKCEPWDIPEVARVGGKEWYFYSQRDRKYATGLRTNRATNSGYWKATGKDKAIVRKSKLVGMRKTLVFYQGRAPKGGKSEWVMHEFRLLEGPSRPPKFSNSTSGYNHEEEEDWVLCRVFCKEKDKRVCHGGVDIHDHSAISSSISLPQPSVPLMMDDHDQAPNYINFDQDHGVHLQPIPIRHQQVPCFSTNFNRNQTSPSPPNFSHVDQPGAAESGIFEPIPAKYDTDNIINYGTSTSINQKMITAFLNQFAKMEDINNTNNFNSISDMGLPSLWNNNY